MQKSILGQIAKFVIILNYKDVPEEVTNVITNSL